MQSKYVENIERFEKSHKRSSWEIHKMKALEAGSGLACARYRGCEIGVVASRIKVVRTRRRGWPHAPKGTLALGNIGERL